MNDVILHVQPKPDDGDGYLLTGEEVARLADLLLCMALEYETWDTLETAEGDKLSVSVNKEQGASKARAYVEKEKKP